MCNQKTGLVKSEHDLERHSWLNPVAAWQEVAHEDLAAKIPSSDQHWLQESPSLPPSLTVVALAYGVSPEARTNYAVLCEGEGSCCP